MEGPSSLPLTNQLAPYETQLLAEFCQKSAFVLRIFKILGAEGGAFQRYNVLAVFTGIFDYLRETARFVFRIVRTLGTVRTQLYLSCS